MKLRGGYIALLLMACVLASADGPREISIITGRGELLQFERDIERVAISEPKIADAIVVSPREIMVNGKGAGKASLIVWDGGSAPSRYNINVANDNSENETSRKELQAGLPEGVQISGSGDTIDLDPARVQQIVVNLVDNALKYAKSRVNVETKGREVRVSDDGPGVPPEHRERIFEKFSKVETGPKPPGAGLGLSIARKLAQLHGATLTCDGNTFVLRF